MMKEWRTNMQLVKDRLVLLEAEKEVREDGLLSADIQVG